MVVGKRGRRRVVEFEEERVVVVVVMKLKQHTSFVAE